MSEEQEDLQLDLDILTMLRAVAESEPCIDHDHALSYELLVETLDADELRDLLCGLAAYAVGMLDLDAHRRGMTVLEVIDEEIRETMDAQRQQS